MISSAVAWQRAVILGAQGRYLAAWWWLDRIDHEHSDGGRLSLSMSTRGSHLRQVGAITQAREWDARALDHADDEESAVEAHLGLAADAIAEGRATTAQVHLREAEAQLVGADQRAWRIATRASWVRSEAMLLDGSIDEAIDTAHRAVDLSRVHSDRHRLKSEAILAAALCAREERAEAIRITRRIAREALRRGWASLSWPIALIALEAEPAGAATGDHQLRAIVAAGVRATRSIEAHLPTGSDPDLAVLWRARSDVGRLRALGGG